MKARYHNSLERWTRAFALACVVTAIAAVCAACGPVPRCDPAPEDAAWERAFQSAYLAAHHDDMMTLLRQRQRSGDPKTSWWMGMSIGDGVGDFPSPLERNHTAMILVKRAALCGHRYAIEDLVTIYGRGLNGVSINVERAICLHRFRHRESGVNAAACGVRLNDRDEIVNPLWDAQVELGRTRPR